MANIIEARVKQKKDTLANWEENPMILLDGEQAFVVSDSGQPVNFKIGDGTKRFSELPFWIQYDGGQYIQITGNVLPEPTVDLGYSLVGPGTYTFAGQPDIVAPEGRLSQLLWDGSSWSLVDMGELPQVDTNGEIISGDNRAVSGDTTYKTLEPYIAIGVDVETELYRGNGTFTATGAYRLSDNWISTRIIPINPVGGEVYTVSGYQQTGDKNVMFYAEDDELNQSWFEVKYGSSSPSPQTFITPAGYTKMIIQVASGPDIGVDIPNSPYQESFKLIKGEIPRVKAEMVKGVINTPQLTGLRSDITALQNKPDYATFEGLGFPQYERGVDGDKYFDYASKRVFTKQHGKWVPKSLSRFYPVPVPAEFGWDIGRRVMYQENGKSFIEGWKGLFEEKAKADFDRLTKYYVSRSVGSDSNDGLTPETAFATVEHAHSIGARNIIVEKGVYAITGGWQMRVITDDDSVTEPFIVRCLEGNALMTRAYLGSEYSWTGENAYVANRTNVINVVDLTHFDDEGNYAQLIRVDSVQECQELPGSYYPLSETIHVHTFDSRVPDENILLCFAAATGYTPGAQVPYCYMENISVINQQASGSSGAFAFRNNVSEQYDCEVYLKNCYAGNNALGDGIAIDNIKVAILEGCSSAYVYRDALNYHTSLLNSGYDPIKVLEIDCQGYDTGTYWPGEYSSNGSTMHEGGTILRINGNYRRGSGSVVVDVNPGIRSLNISVEANDTTLNDGFRVNGEGSIMWLYGCVAYSDLDGANSLRAQDGATAYYDSRCIFPNNIDGDVIPE